MKQKNLIEWACEFKRYSQYAAARREFDRGNNAFEDVLSVLAWMHPRWMQKYNAESEQV